MPDDLTRLFRLARALCGSRALAEQLTEEAYASAGAGFTALAAALLGLLDGREPADEPVVLAGEIYAAVAGLPAELRDAVALVDVAGMSYADAALVLRLPQTTVLTRLHRARTRLARSLARAA